MSNFHWIFLQIKIFDHSDTTDPYVYIDVFLMFPILSTLTNKHLRPSVETIRTVSRVPAVETLPTVREKEQDTLQMGYNSVLSKIKTHHKIWMQNKMLFY